MARNPEGFPSRQNLSRRFSRWIRNKSVESDSLVKYFPRAFLVTEYSPSDTTVENFRAYYQPVPRFGVRLHGEPFIHAEILSCSRIDDDALPKQVNISQYGENINTMYELIFKTSVQAISYYAAHNDDFLALTSKRSGVFDTVDLNDDTFSISEHPQTHALMIEKAGTEGIYDETNTTLDVVGENRLQLSHRDERERLLNVIQFPYRYNYAELADKYIDPALLSRILIAPP